MPFLPAAKGMQCACCVAEDLKKRLSDLCLPLCIREKNKKEKCGKIACFLHVSNIYRRYAVDWIIPQGVFRLYQNNLL